jgi:tRNA threonylcarbamoyladenosine biosynthesis protein TsaE
VSAEKGALRIEIPTQEQMHEFGIRLGRLLEKGDLLSLNGPLGAGKTTLTRGIGEGLEADGNISSPTFLIARTHATKSGVPFVHIDAYRLSSVAELDDLDIDFDNSISVIEWGSGFAEGISESLLEISIDRKLETESRTLELFGYGPRFSILEQLLGADDD